MKAFSQPPIASHPLVQAGQTKVPLCSTGLRPLRGRCPTGLTPEDLDLRPKKPNFRPERPGLRPERLDLRLERLDLKPEMPDLRPERPDWGSERPDLKSEEPDGGTNGWTDGRTNRFPLCSTGLRPLWGRCPKTDGKTSNGGSLHPK